MKYVDEFRDGTKARAFARAIAAEVTPGRSYALMEFCGGHTHAISRYGIQDLLPDAVTLIHGPGCPVCVLPIGRIDGAVAMARRTEVILCTYGDLMRVPGSKRVSLIKAKAEGCDIRMVYSTLDAVKLAEDNPDRTVVFFAIGFETTTPPTALAIKAAEAKGLSNFLVYVNHVLTPAALSGILDGAEAVTLDGVIGPSHVSTVIGLEPYRPYAERYKLPIVIAGFEPLDVMQSILMLIRQINDGRYEIENQYTRAVLPQGNTKAVALVDEVFEVRDSFAWRGFGALPHSGLKLRAAYARFDAERVLAVDAEADVPDNPACECGAIVRGRKKPRDCKLFGKVCTPDNPMGSCMVSAEGACAAYWTYGRFRDATPTPSEAAE